MGCRGRVCFGVGMSATGELQEGGMRSMTGRTVVVRCGPSLMGRERRMMKGAEIAAFFGLQCFEAWEGGCWRMLDRRGLELW